ncbi:MAG: Rieske 2Fe-2S domain-containing protein [Proteobacteria bacterium]|nr:Rieske 2Fe-2S domain-containing protein [Pseudomonadota bacterium]
MTATTVDELRQLVKPDRVHRDIYQNPEIFDMEMERIYGRSWVYIGHESQVAKPGDFFCSWIGTQPVVMTRHTDGKVYVLHNRCGHRGVKVVTEASGNSKFLRCMFHGWTYELNGELTGLTQPEGYTTFDVDPVAFGMPQVARTQSVHGFLFASAAADGPSFGEYFGGVTSAIDDLVAYAPDGEVEVTGGVLRYGYPGNWKHQADNVCDMYHVVYSHESSSRGGAQYVRRQGDASGIPFFDTEGGVLTFDASGLWGFPNGHGWEGALPQFENTDALWHEYVALLEAKNGKERTKEILTRKRHNTVFYPNVVIQDLNMHVRVIRPIRVDLTEITIYPIKLKGAPAQMFRDSIRLLNTTNSAASLTQADDVEAFTRGHAGLRNRDGNPWVLFARGDPANEVADDTYENGFKTFGSSEMLLRFQYKAWLEQMTAAA